MKRLTLILAVFALTSLTANAISVASDYLADDTLELTGGASKIYSIRLQNPNDKEAGVKLDYDSTFMKAKNYQSIYTLPPKTSGYRIEFNITAPKETGLYKIGYTVSEVEPAGSSGVPVRLKTNKNFYLSVVEGSKISENLNIPATSLSAPATTTGSENLSIPNTSTSPLSPANSPESKNYSALKYVAVLIIAILLTIMFNIWKSSSKNKRNIKLNK